MSDPWSLTVACLMGDAPPMPDLSTLPRHVIAAPVPTQRDPYVAAWHKDMKIAAIWFALAREGERALTDDGDDGGID